MLPSHFPERLFLEFPLQISMAHAKPQVYVLMAVCNGAPWLPEQVQSVLNQEQVSVRLFISVDVSTDDSLAYCQRISEENQEVEVLGYGETFGSATRNFSRLIAEVDTADADFVAFCDQDDIWNSDKLIRSIRTLSEKGCSAVSSNVTAFWGDGRKRLIVKSQPKRKLDYVLEAAGPGSTYLLSQPVWYAYKNWLSERLTNELPPHDWLIYAYCRIYGYPWFILSESTVLYRQHEGNFMGANLGFRGRINRIETIRSGEFKKDVSRLKHLFGPDFPISTTRFGLLKHWFQLRRKRSEAVIFALLCLVFW